MTKKYPLLLLCLSLSISTAMAGSFPFFWKKKKAKTEVADSTKTKKVSEYDKLFKEKHPTADGLIKLHNLKGKLYFELPVKLLDREMLIGSTISEISNNNDGIIGSKPAPPLHVKFTKQNDYIQLRKVSCDYMADDPDSNIAKAIEMSSIGAILRSMKIAVYSSDSSTVVFDMTDFFLSDNKDMPPFDAMGLYEMMGYKRSPSFQRDKSYLGEIKAFSDNVTIKSYLSYTYTLTRTDGRTLVKDMPFTAAMTRSILLLNEKPYRPRTGDYRMAIFPTGKYLFSEKDQSSRVTYFSNRWNLQPSDSAAYLRGEKVAPVKPIVFYVDNNFPEMWKKYIREGIEQWNELFGEIGFKDVVIAKDFPTDDPAFDPDNMKYSCIRYAPIRIANAMGPSWTDPRSGEIINASVYVYHNIIELLNNWMFVQTSQTDPRVRTKKIPEELIGDGLRYVISHEIGHCLGFMHNMGASAVIPVDSLRSPSFTQKYGTTTSIMDYARFNYVAQPGDYEKGVKLTPPRFGEYDRFAVKWLYTAFPDKTPEEELSTLNQWIRVSSANSVYHFGKQQGMPLDPRSQTEDLGDNAMKASDYGIKNLKYILTNFSAWVDKDDDDYSYRSKIYDAIIMQYVMYLNHVYANVGGVYLQEVKKGDTGVPYKSVPKKIQKEALQYLFNQFNNVDWIDYKELTRKLSIAGSAKEMLEQSIARAIIASPEKVRFSATISEDPYNFNDCADEVFAFVWKSTLAGRKPTSGEMRMQREFINRFLVGASLLPEQAQSMFFAENNQITIDMPHAEDNHQHICSCGIDHAQETEVYNPTAGYGYAFAKLSPLFPNESGYYGYLLKVQSLLKRSIPGASAEVRAHYELLSKNLENTLKTE